jgi:HAD superfamily hydrolase (TIGR01509 family)
MKQSLAPQASLDDTLAPQASLDDTLAPQASLDDTLAPQASLGNTLQAVLFDLDGTLVDTEPYWIAAEYDLVESFGGIWTDRHAHALVGNPLLVSAAYIRDHGPVPLEPAEIVERLLEDVVRRTAARIPWRPGALALLAGLREAGVPCALVTMSYRPLADVVVAALPEGSFAAVVTGDQVRSGKPDPEAYLTAAALLGVEPGRCVAIEDSPPGIASAEAAGCVVVAVPHTVPVRAAATRTIVGSLESLHPAGLSAMLPEA